MQTDTLNTIIDRAERQCRKNGARLTDKRKQALALLICSGKALSAYELVDAYNKQVGGNLPAMSMYRILDFLTQQKFVHKLQLANKYVACEHINCEHEHTSSQFLICSKCQKVKEFSVSEEAMLALNKNIESSGFYLQSKQLEMNCICENCL